MKNIPDKYPTKQMLQKLPKKSHFKGKSMLNLWLDFINELMLYQQLVIHQAKKKDIKKQLDKVCSSLQAWTKAKAKSN